MITIMTVIMIRKTKKNEECANNNNDNEPNYEADAAYVKLSLYTTGKT